MKAILITATGQQFGPFASVETLSDRYRAGGIEFQFDVIGPATVEDYTEPARDLVPIRAELWGLIKAVRDTKKLEGGYTTGGKWYHSDVFSRTQQLGLVMMGAGIPANTLWKTMDGSFVTMTQTLAGQIFSAAAAQDAALFTHAETLKAQVDASSNPESIDLNAGWPETYQ